MNPTFLTQSHQVKICRYNCVKLQESAYIDLIIHAITEKWSIL